MRRVSARWMLALFIGFNVCRPAELMRDASQSKGDLPALVVVVTPARTVFSVLDIREPHRDLSASRALDVA
jgi:hypothetical protein